MRRVAAVTAGAVAAVLAAAAAGSMLRDRPVADPNAPARPDAAAEGARRAPPPRAMRAARELASILDALRESRHAAALAGVVALLADPTWEEMDRTSRVAFLEARLDLARWALGEAEALARAGEWGEAVALLARAERCLDGLPADAEFDAARARVRALIADAAARRAAAGAAPDTLEPLLARLREEGARDPVAARAEAAKALAAETDPARAARLAAEIRRLDAVLAGRARRADLRRRADAAVARGDYAGAAGHLARAIEDAGADPGAAADEAARDAAKKEALKELEENGEPPVLAAVRKALRWMVAQQLEDGSFGWTAIEAKERGLPEDRRGSHHRVQGLTALAGLALVGHARHDLTDEFLPALDRALDRVLAKQRKDGSFPGSMYDHAISTLFLVDADRYLVRPRVRAAAAAAVAWLAAARNADGGWRYQARTGVSDVSVTGWAVQALLHAEQGRWDVPRDVLDGALAYLDRMTDPTGRVGYTDPGRGSLAMTAAALFCRLRFGQGVSDERVRAAADLLVAKLPKAGWGETSYHLFYASDAMSRLGGDYWRRWGPALKRYLLDAQVAKGDAAGAWPTAGDRWATEAGSVYLCAMNSLSLENFFERRE